MCSQAQVLPEKEIEDRLGTNRKGKEHHLPVMFFGTLEVAWVTRADTCSWSEGVEKGLYSKGHGRRSFQTAVEQVPVPSRLTLRMPSALYMPAM